MSDSDSFINEVNEEVRRDRLYALLRRWGWVPVLLILAIVGGAAFFEYNRAQTEAQAQAFGDNLLAALDATDPQARITGLSGIEATGPEAQAVVAFLLSGERAGNGDRSGAAIALRTAAEAPGLAPRYRDLALLRAEMVDPSEPSEARVILAALAEPGAPYAGLAQEQLALLALREGDRATALDAFRRIEGAATSTQGLRQRAGQMIVAIEAGSEIVDSAPQDATADGGEDAPDAADAGTGNAGAVTP